MHAILVDVTHYGLKVIAKYQSSTRDLPGHKIQKKWTIFQVKLHLVKQFSIFEIAWQWQLFEFERSILNTMIVWFARHLAIQDVYKNIGRICISSMNHDALQSLFGKNRTRKSLSVRFNKILKEWIYWDRRIL